jgi:hypothetical protein
VDLSNVVSVEAIYPEYPSATPPAASTPYDNENQAPPPASDVYSQPAPNDLTPYSYDYGTPYGYDYAAAAPYYSPPYYTPDLYCSPYGYPFGYGFGYPFCYWPSFGFGPFNAFGRDHFGFYDRFGDRFGDRGFDAARDGIGGFGAGRSAASVGQFNSAARLNAAASARTFSAPSFRSTAAPAFRSGGTTTFRGSAAPFSRSGGGFSRGAFRGGFSRGGFSGGFSHGGFSGGGHGGGGHGR